MGSKASKPSTEGAKPQAQEEWKRERCQPQARNWLPRYSDVLIKKTDGSTVPANEVGFGKPQMKSPLKQLDDYVVFQGKETVPVGLTFCQRLRREMSGDLFTDRSKLQYMMIGRGFVLFGTTTLEVLWRVDVFQPETVEVLESVKLVMDICLYIDYIAGIFLSALLSTAISAISGSLAFCGANTKKSFNPMYLRSVKLQTLGLLCVIVVIRLLTADFVPWWDEELKVSSKLGAMYWLSVHHIMAIGITHN